MFDICLFTAKSLGENLYSHRFYYKIKSFAYNSFSQKNNITFILSNNQTRAYEKHDQ